MPGNYNVTTCTKQKEIECKMEHYDGGKNNCFLVTFKHRLSSSLLKLCLQILLTKKTADVLLIAR